ncbi:MAG: S41 family peptidase [Muribaculaceae bacterium]|nr:S41 family peptidase [Muribaculaceae bacterium]
MKRIWYLIAGACIMAAAESCHEIEEFDNGMQGNFDALWTTVDRHYCFFDQKRVDWDSVYLAYKPLISDTMDVFAYFDVCARMLDELRDGHVNLSSSFRTSYYRKWWSDYPQNFDERLIQQNYFNFEYNQVGGMTYGLLADSTIGYIRYPSFSYGIGEGTLDLIFYQMKDCLGIVFDIRDNSGGNLTNVETLVSRFIDSRIKAGAISHKNGPGHNDFSEPYDFYYEPAAGHARWLRPVAVITNRSTFSAANNFAGIMKTLPMVTIVGATTGGGSGMPFSSEIPCGWGVRMSGSRLYDPNGVETENGVTPTSGYEVDLDPKAASRGVDTMLEAAIAAIYSFYDE